MKKTNILSKTYLEHLPYFCYDCLYFNYYHRRCKLTEVSLLQIRFNSKRPKNCPLISINKEDPYKDEYLKRIYILKNLYKYSQCEKRCFDKYFTVEEMQKFFNGSRKIENEDIEKFIECMGVKEFSMSLVKKLRLIKLEEK